MPEGVDTERYQPIEKIDPSTLGFDLNKFVFLSVFKWGYRKGFDILLKAYFDEFSSNDDVSLFLLTRCETDNNPNRIADDIGYLRSGIDKTDEDLPHIVVHTKKIPEKTLPKIYNMSDAFVLPSLGEGFGLIYLEAAACGLPVIGTNCSGQSDFLKKDNSYLLDPDDMKEVKTNGNMSKLAKHCGFYEGQVFPDFSTTGVKKLRKYMREVYEDYGAAIKKAQILTNLTHNEYSWDKAVERVLNRIKEIRR
jgi:glycosyltransferase involved in cell wall biosynthesis